jgi:hypothetical protein
MLYGSAFDLPLAASHTRDVLSSAAVIARAVLTVGGADDKPLLVLATRTVTETLPQPWQRMIAAFADIANAIGQDAAPTSSPD